MGRSGFREVVSCVLLILLPASLLAADSTAAMLYTTGTAWVNGAHVPRASSAIFSGDMLQTRSDSVANINSAGSSITVLSNSLVQFEGSGVKIEHGAVAVSTSKGVATTAGDVKVSPVSSAWTEFNVTDVDGTVRIAARKGDVTIFDGKDTFTLAQGQETSRDESSDQSDKENKKKSKKRAAGAAPGAEGGILNTPLAIEIGAGIIGLTTILVLAHDDDPASPSKP
ncbi:MAG: hypothetical protein DMG77_13795 [Acidobacteria bacterium]|nr:MAG: hypothetical protein DMG77_13795 [Acidobacteriota bacterium]